MATFKSVASVEFQITPGAGNGLSASVPRPDTGGTPASGDTIFHALLVPNAEKANFIPPSLYTQVGSWIVGEIDGFGVPAFGLFKRTYAISPPTSETWMYDQDATRGGHIFSFCYSGDCTVQQLFSSTVTSQSGSRSGPAVTAASGNLILALHGGSAVSNPGVAWAGGFTERFDREYYGINSGAELAGDNTAKTPSVSPTDPSQSMWIVLDLGANSPPSPGGGTSRRMLMGVG